MALNWFRGLLAPRTVALAADRWHAQLEAYQIMSTDELLMAEEVRLTISLKAIISRHGMRVVCEQCGEDIINEREVYVDGQILCQSCAGNAYYERSVTVESLPMALQLLQSNQ
jgi:formylmethanofuran dehydrogenase subunit E